MTNATAQEPEAAGGVGSPQSASGSSRSYAGGFVYGRDKLGMTLSEKV